MKMSREGIPIPQTPLPLPPDFLLALGSRVGFLFRDRCQLCLQRAFASGKLPSAQHVDVRPLQFVLSTDDLFF